MKSTTTVIQPLKRAVRLWTARWPDYSRLFPVADIGTWVIGQEMRSLKTIVQRLGGRCARPVWIPHSRRQCVFYGSQYALLSDDWLAGRHRVAVAYFHGLPDSGYEDFDRLYDRVCRHHERLDRVQVSHRQMHDLILNTGIDPGKVFRIPIGVRSDIFSMADDRSARVRRRIRRRLGIPQDAVVVGSFQKDGQGWGAGDEPKLIKGPDILLAALDLLKPRVPNLHVLLTGPARGYVKNDLAKRRIPYRHVQFARYADLGEIYQALDIYLVTSRQEGGPKAVLESMAAGIPLVSTRVGQASDLITHGVNGWLVDVEDADALAGQAEWIMNHPRDVEAVVEQGRRTARENDYRRQIPLWGDMLRGFLICRE